MNRLVIFTASLFLVLALATPTLAKEKTDGFVCPVIFTDAVLHSPKGTDIGEGHYTIVGPEVSVPVNATNANGSGTPSGPHSEPGMNDYTAIWAGN